MKKLLNWLKNEESGQSMVEYGLIVLVVVVIISGVAVLFGPQITAVFTSIGTQITAAQTAAGATP